MLPPQAHDLEREPQIVLARALGAQVIHKEDPDQPVPHQPLHALRQARHRLAQVVDYIRGGVRRRDLADPAVELQVLAQGGDRLRRQQPDALRQRQVLPRVTPERGATHRRLAVIGDHEDQRRQRQQYQPPPEIRSPHRLSPGFDRFDARERCGRRNATEASAA
jgi:hypothetical protein